MKQNFTPYEIDSEDSSYLLDKIEHSFDIQFGATELAHISNFGELCDHITNKIQLDNSTDCTTQQAFYKLRTSISWSLQLDNKTISTNTLLSEILPRHNRRSKTSKIEKDLGFKLSILRPPHWVTGLLSIFIVASLIGLFFVSLIGFIGLVFSFTCLKIANKIGNEFSVKTVGDVAEKMSRENYLKVRRNSKTYNRNEIEKILSDLFCNELYIEKTKLTREARFT